MNDFARRLLRWWRDHGRHDLPWQMERSPYRVWIAEIMLQQTRVATVIDYFERFVARFPDLPSLAGADLDDVLALWSGLGYYARARNLHAAAIRCMTDHGGRLPETPESLRELPGIGPSTANAIIAQAHDRRAPILDGNVKRVLARHAGIEGWPGRSAVNRRLWAESESRTPKDHARDYTQAIMDLGAMVCTSASPDCGGCPVRTNCLARRQHRVHELPGKKPPRQQPRRRVTLAVVENGQGQILLERRPPTGIWGGLWSLPALEDVSTGDKGEAMATIEHHFTHFILDIGLQRLPADNSAPIEDRDERIWATPRRALEMGLPRPIRDVIEQISGEHP